MIFQTGSMTRLRSAARAATFALAAAAFVGGPAALAQETVERRESFEAWAVFAPEAGPQRSCFAATVPLRSETSRDGVRRGQAYLQVAVFPSENVSNQVSVIFGYPTDPNLPIRIEIGSTAFDLFSDNEMAWLADRAQDEALIAAMRRGAEARVTATSTRGTTITDVYSLRGLTASTNRLGELCN